MFLSRYGRLEKAYEIAMKIQAKDLFMVSKEIFSPKGMQCPHIMNTVSSHNNDNEGNAVSSHNDNEGNAVFSHNDPCIMM